MGPRIPLPPLRSLSILLAIAGPLASSPAAAQQFMSPARSVTLVAIKPQPVDALHAVAIAPGSEPGMLAVRIVRDAECHITVRVGGGSAREAFAGRCHAASPNHPVDVLSELARASGDSATVDLLVVAIAGAEVVRWTAAVRMPSGAAARCEASPPVPRCGD